MKDLDEKVRSLETELESLQSLERSGAETWPLCPITVSPSHDILPLNHNPSKTQDVLSHTGESSAPGYLGLFHAYVGPASVVDLGLATVKSAGVEMIKNGLLGVCPPPLRTTMVEMEKVDRSIAAPSTIRKLIQEYYFQVLHPRYPVVEPVQVEFEGSLTQLPALRRLFIIITAATAAAHRSRRDQSMQTIALVLRSWADELITEVASRQDDDSIQAMALLIFYELVHPGRRLIWHLLGLVGRMIVRLGWHRQEERESEHLIAPTLEDGLPGHVVRYPSAWRRRLFSVIFEWER